MGPLIERFRAIVRSSLRLEVKHLNSLYTWQIGVPPPQPKHPESLPPGALEYLKPQNPRLLELKERYSRIDPAVTKGITWDMNAAELRSIDLQFFRDDNPFIFQQRASWGNELSYALTWYKCLAGPEAPLLRCLTEDSLFGAFVVEVDGASVSRDILDSATEMRFLVEHAGLGAGTRGVLDIGAGYGRLPYRLSQAFPDLKSWATDAVPASTFLSEYYLRFRGSPAQVLPLDEVDDFLEREPIDIATNIHSFSECRVEAIDWWVRRLAKAQIRYLMVIPNDALDGPCMTNAGENMNEIFARHNYQLRVRQRRFHDPILHRWGVDPGVMSLFELA